MFILCFYCLPTIYDYVRCAKTLPHKIAERRESARSNHLSQVIWKGGDD